MFFDPLYLILVFLPGLVISSLAALYVKSQFATYSRVPSASGLTGAAAAAAMLRSAGITDVVIERSRGFLSDHYDPSAKALRLSNDVYSSTSLSAIGVACHEAGHALQHASGYEWLSFRSALVPAVNICSSISYIVIVMGMLFRSPSFAGIGCALFAMVFLFTLVTLPVEWNASARAKIAMQKAGFLNGIELEGASSVLNAAFLTYVASAVTTLLTLLYYVLQVAAMSNRRR